MQLIGTYIGQCRCRPNHSDKQSTWNKCLHCVFTTPTPVVKLLIAHSDRQITQEFIPNSTISGTYCLVPNCLRMSAAVGIPGGTTGLSGRSCCLLLRRLKRQASATRAAIRRLSRGYSPPSTDKDIITGFTQVRSESPFKTQAPLS